MSLLYVDEHSASLNYSPVSGSETITEGSFIVQNDDGTVSQFDPANDPLPHGIVVHDAGGDSISDHDEDYSDYEDLWTFDGSEGDNLYWQPLTSVDQIRPRSIDEQTDPESIEPEFSEGDVVGIVTLGSGETRVVPSGYEYDVDGDGTVETFSESGAGDFVAIGRMDKYPQELRIESAYDQRIPTRLDADTFSTSG